MNTDELKRGFYDGYGTFVEYAENECSQDFYEDFETGEFALTLKDEVDFFGYEGDDPTRAMEQLSDKVNEALEFDEVSYETGYFFGLNVAFGAATQLPMFSERLDRDGLVEALKDRLDNEWNLMKEACVNEGMLV